MTKPASEHEPIYCIVAAHVDQDMIGSADYFDLIDALNAREEAFRSEMQKDINLLKAENARLKVQLEKVYQKLDGAITELANQILGDK